MSEATVIEPVAAVEETKFFTFEEGSFPLHIVPYNKEIPDELLSDKGASFVLHGTDLFQLKQSPLHSVMSGVDQDDKFFSKTFGESKYDPDKVYMLRNDWDQFKFPVDQFRYVMKYFRELYNKHKSEAAVLLMLNQKTKDWQVLFVLQCSASGASVVYAQPIIDSSNIENWQEKRIIEAIMKDKVAAAFQTEIYNRYNDLYNKGYRIYGTIHSHCNFGAFHSGTDDHDEKNFDGLHITIGNVNSGWSYSCRYMASTASFPIDITKVLGIEDTKSIEEDIDSILVEDEHMNLMMPNLLREAPAVVTTYPTTEYNYGRNNNAPSYNIYPTSNYGNNSWSSGGSDTWSDNVWKEVNVYRVYNWKTNEVLHVKVAFWNKMKNIAFRNHEIIPDGPIPLELLTKNKEWENSDKLSTPCPKELVEKNDAATNETVSGPRVVDFDNTNTDITLFNTPLLNERPIHPDDPTTKTGKLFQWMRKATKIIRK